jgi:cytochrome c-type biogenesis protein CcmH
MSAAHTMRLRTAARALVLLLALGGTCAASGTIAFGAVARTTLPAVESQAMCVTCKIPLPVAQSPQAERERAFIQKRIDEGLTEAQIKRALVYQYGPAVLALPSTKGFDLAAYIVPIVVALGLLALLLVLLPSWRRRGRSEPPAPGAVLSDHDNARLEEDMARFD